LGHLEQLLHGSHGSHIFKVKVTYTVTYTITVKSHVQSGDSRSARAPTEDRIRVRGRARSYGQDLGPTYTGP
jgi:hypothetical protein